ncbi:hypothetical protein TYRP_001459 [Tyrophagus putrescentiae]|nr:hypothetical protein TYRP_001459 [Tyrophagus putrescentiae]
MGSSSSKLKSRPSKLFKRASFRRGSKKKKEKQQASSNGAVHLSSNGTAVQNGSLTNDVTVLSNGNGNNSTPAVHLQPSDQQQVVEPSLSPSPSPSPSPSSPSPQPPSSPSPSSSPSPHPEIIESTPSPQPPPSSPECLSSPHFENGHNHRENNAYSTLNLPTTSSARLQRSSKRKSRSIGHLLRRSASMKGGTTSSSTAASPSPDNIDAAITSETADEKSKSTFSLTKRFSSLKSIGSFRRFRRSRSARQLQTELAKAETEELAALEALFKNSPAEVPPPGEECYFSSLYEGKLHQKVFRGSPSEPFANAGKLNSSKRRPPLSIRFSPFHKEAHLNRKRKLFDHHWEAQQATSASNRYLYYASNVQRLAVKGRLTRGTLENLVKYCFSKQLSSVEFRADPESANEKCDIISTSVLEAFSAKFGPQLEEVTVTTSSKHLSFLSKNNDLTDVILFLLYTNSEHFYSLTRFGCSIGNKLSNGYFQMFQSEFGAQLRHLTLELAFDAATFTSEAAKTLERIGSTMEGLQSLSISLLPRPSPSSAAGKTETGVPKLPLLSTSIRKSDLLLLGPLLELIGQLPQQMTNLTAFNLAVDVVSAEIADLNGHLDFLETLSRFTRTKSLSLTLYGDLKAMESCQALRLNFEHLRQNRKLKKFSLDCAKTSDVDIERLVRAAPQLTQLSLGVDVRVTGSTLVDQISASF